MKDKWQKAKSESSTNTHYRTWKTGKRWCYGFSVLAAITGSAVLFQETAAADGDGVKLVENQTAAAQTDVNAKVEEQSTAEDQVSLTQAQAEDSANVDNKASAEPETEPAEQSKLPQKAEENTQAQPLQDLPDAAAPAAHTEEIVEEYKVQADTVNPKPENTEPNALPQIPAMQSSPQTPELLDEPVSPDATGVWGDISWVYDSATQTLRFTSSGTIPPRNYENYPNYIEERPWMKSTHDGADIKKIVFEKAVTAPINASGLFAKIPNVQKIEGLEKIDVSAATNISGMFFGCAVLTDIAGLSSWDVSSVTDMNSVFAGCAVLTNLTALSGWDVSSVTDMNGMFGDCHALTDITGLSSWDVSSVKNMDNMFSFCYTLTDLASLSNWNVSKVTSMMFMFCDCLDLTDITGLSTWDVSSVTDMNQMFVHCSTLTDLAPLSNWNVSKVTNMTFMFGYCDALTDLTGLSNWNVSKVETMFSMFNNCRSLKNADALNNWSVQGGVQKAFMFFHCSNLQSIGIAAWKLREDINTFPKFTAMFEGCTRLSTIMVGSNSYWLSAATLAGLSEIDTSSGEYTGEWIGLNTGRIYRSSEDFVANYDGSIPDTYVWRKKLTATVHYDVNGGNSSSDPTDETRPFLQGEAGGVTASAIVPVRDETARAGYEFAGWNTMPDGSGTFYQAGELVKCPGGGSTTLYAQWREKLKSSTVTVHYVDENGNEIASPVEITGTIDDAYATRGLSDNQLHKGDIFYVLAETPSNATGVYAAGGITVTYVYRAVKPPICLPPESPGPTTPKPPTPSPDKENPYTLTNMSLPVSATQTESTVTKPRVLPNTGSNSGILELLAGAVSLLGAGVSMAVRLKRRRN